MAQRWIMTAFLVLMILSVFSIGTLRAQSIDVTVGQNSVTLSMDLSLHENLSSLPLFNIQVGQSNTSSIYQQIFGPLNAAIQGRVPTANISSLTLNARTFNSSGTWFLEENYSITVIGANVENGSTVSSNLSFIQMNLSQSIPVRNQELNAVGSAYLLRPLNNLSSQYSTLVYFIDGATPRNNVIPDETTILFHLLEFTWVPSVSTWTSQPNILGQSTTWILNPAQAQYNLTLGVPTPEGPIIRAYTAIYNTSLSVSVPSNTRIDGNIVTYDTPTSSEIAMPALLAVSVVALIGTVILDRKISGRFRFAKKKR
jgi:hypothetical protein